MADRISVIVPVYNVAADLPRCLDSILAQTYPDIEIVAVDDGSPDNSGGILDRYAEKYPSIRVIHKENGGVTSARLCGIQEASGDWIGFVDGDDEIEPNMYAQLINNAKNHNAQISHCGYQMIFPNGRVSYFHNTGVTTIKNKTDSLIDLLNGNMIEPSLCNKLFLRTLFVSVLEDCKIMQGIKINEDLLMNFLLFLNAEQSVFVDWCPYHYIVREQSATRSSFSKNQIYDPLYVKEYILQISPNRVQNSAKAAYVRTCIGIYNNLTLANKKTFKDDLNNIRERIIEHKAWGKLLSAKHQLLLKIICYFPWCYAPIYKVYNAFFSKNPYR